MTTGRSTAGAAWQGRRGAGSAAWPRSASRPTSVPFSLIGPQHPTHHPYPCATTTAGTYACRRWDDASVSPVLRQTMLHWAYELTEADFNKMRKKM